MEEDFNRGGLWAAVVVMVGWHLLASLPTVISGWLKVGPAGVGAEIWLVFAVVGGVSAWIVLRGGGQSVTLPLVVCPILLIGAGVGALSARYGFFGPYNWPFTVTGWFALVALWRHSLAALVAFFVANTLVGLAALTALGQTDRLSVARFIMLCAGVSVLEITIFVGSRAVATTARRRAMAQDALVRTRTKQLAAEAVHAARRIRYEAIRETVVPLLDALVTGRLDLADSAVRQEVAVAVGRLRRFLVENDEVPDPLSHELRACADAAERRGIAVDLVAPTGAIPALPVEVRRALTDPVIQVLAASATRARITVVASPAEVVVAIVADAHLETLLSATREAVRVAHDGEGELLWVQAQWSDPSLSRS
jgi:hypothetical protein